MSRSSSRAVSGGAGKAPPFFWTGARAGPCSHLRHRCGRRIAASLVLGATVAACGGGTSGPGQPAPDRGDPISGPLEAYGELGLVTGPGYFPAVAGFSTIAGPADSTFVLFGLSMPNSALRFQRDPAGFVAAYTITLTFATPDSQTVRQVTRRESVRIPTFQETGRTDESILFQHLITILPGRYLVTVEAADANGSRGFSAQDTLDVPAYTGQDLSLSQPVLVYEGSGRAALDSVPELILNPRNTVAYGGDAPHVYVEAYNAASPAPVTVSVLDEFEFRVWSARTTIERGDSMLRRAMINLPAGSLPLGRLSVEVRSEDGVARVTAPLVISISDQWLIASFEEVLQFLEFIATRAEIDSLRSGTPAERRKLWDAFWKRRDPVPATQENEYRDGFFERVRVATEQFSEAGGLPGWRTDRGEVYIVLGPPTFVQERYIGITEFVGRPNAWEWLYDNAPGGRLVLLFLDRNGFGHYELSASSESAFRAIADRLKRGDPANLQEPG